jgi:regulator of sigma D
MKIQKELKMNLNEKDLEKFLGKLQDILSEIKFGKIFCSFIISDERLMYVDFKQEKSERIYIHNNLNKNMEETNNENS